MNKLHEQPNTKRGAALLLFIVFFLFASSGLTYLISKSIYADFVTHRLLFDSKVSYMTAESSLEDVVYRRINGSFDVDLEEVLVLGGATATTTTVFDTATNQLVIDTEGNDTEAVRKVSLKLQISSGASFNFGVQTGNGGFFMNNTARVIGNVFSNGSVIGGAGAGKARIEGDVISAGAAGLVDGIHATGSVRSHTIDDSNVDVDAYYQVIDLGDTTVLGTLYPGSVDETASSLPFPDSEVEAHKATVTSEIAAGNGQLIASTSAECGGSSSGTFTIDNSTTTDIMKVECNMLVDKNSTTWTVTDTVWVEGNLTFKSGPTVLSTPTDSTKTILIAVDNESNRTTSSKIDIQNGTIFSAPSSPKAYIMLVSMNDSAENSGSEIAIDMGQSSTGDVIIYSGHGKISLSNSITLKEVTGYLIDMGQSTVIEYESGLINLNFTSGPGGGFEIASWNEVE